MSLYPSIITQVIIPNTLILGFGFPFSSRFPAYYLRRLGLPSHPDSLESFMMIMSMGFNPRGAGDTTAVIQFNFSGDVDGSCHFKIANGKIEAFPEIAEKPDLTIEAPFNIWVGIMTGKADGHKMFMEQKFNVSGDLSILIRMNQFFKK
jgi:putative sterol carrier protein